MHDLSSASKAVSAAALSILAAAFSNALAFSLYLAVTASHEALSPFFGLALASDSPSLTRSLALALTSAQGTSVPRSSLPIFLRIELPPLWALVMISLIDGSWE